MLPSLRKVIRIVILYGKERGKESNEGKRRTERGLDFREEVRGKEEKHEREIRERTKKVGFNP